MHLLTRATARLTIDLVLQPPTEATEEDITPCMAAAWVTEAWAIVVTEAWEAWEAWECLHTE